MMDGFRSGDSACGNTACRDSEALVAYLYSETDTEERRRFEAHLKACPACAREVEALSEVRQELALWLPPEPELGFTIVQKPGAVLRPGRWWARPLPLWSQAAAAVLVLAAGAAIANVHVRYDNDGLTVSTGWRPAAAPGAEDGRPSNAQVTAASVPLPAVQDDWRSRLSALEAEMRREMQSLRVANAPAPQTSDAAILKRVLTLIDESEQRQRQELALRLTQFGRDVELQRRTDLVRIEQGFGQFEGRTGAEVARQRQLLDYLVRTSGRQVVP